MKIEIVKRPSVQNGDRSRLVFTPENEQERVTLLPALEAMLEGTLCKGKVPRIFHYVATHDEGDAVGELKLDFEFSNTQRAHLDGVEPNKYHPSGKHEVAMVAINEMDMYLD
jgi:hypothetical protein